MPNIMSLGNSEDCL